MALMSRLCCAGTVTKNHGAGPFQNKILPLNSMFISTVYQTPHLRRLYICQPGISKLTNERIIRSAVFRHKNIEKALFILQSRLTLYWTVWVIVVLRASEPLGQEIPLQNDTNAGYRDQRGQSLPLSQVRFLDSEKAG